MLIHTYILDCGNKDKGNDDFCWRDIRLWRRCFFYHTRKTYAWHMLQQYYHSHCGGGGAWPVGERDHVEQREDCLEKKNKSVIVHSMCGAIKKNVGCLTLSLPLRTVRCRCGVPPLRRLLKVSPGGGWARAAAARLGERENEDGGCNFGGGPSFFK